jgi:hypothetical protein
VTKPTEEYLLRIDERMKTLADELGLTLAERREVFARASWLAQRLRDEAHDDEQPTRPWTGSGPCPPGFFCVHEPKCPGAV